MRASDDSPWKDLEDQVLAESRRRFRTVTVLASVVVVVFLSAVALSATYASNRLKSAKSAEERASKAVVVGESAVEKAAQIADAKATEVKRLSALETTVEQQSKFLTSVEKKVAPLEKTVRSLDALPGRVDTLSQEVKVAVGASEKARNELAEFMVPFKNTRPASRYEMAVAINQRYSGLVDRFEQLKAEVGGQEKRLEEFNSLIQSYPSRQEITEFKQNIAQLRQDGAASRRMLAEFERELAGLGGSLESMKSDLKASLQRITAIERRIGGDPGARK